MPERHDRHRASEPRGSRSGSRQRRWGSLRGGVGVAIVAASAALGAIITIAHRSQPGRVLGVCIVVGAVIAAFAVRPRAGRLIFPVPVLAYLIAALTAGIAYNRSTSKTELVIGSAQWIANGFFLMALATCLAIVLVTVRWILRRQRDRRAPAVPDRSGDIALRPPGGRDQHATTADRRDLPRPGGWSDPGSPGVPRPPASHPGQRPPASDGAGQRNGPYPGQQRGPYPGQGYGQPPAQRPGQGNGQPPAQRPGQGNGQYPGQRTSQGNGQYPGPRTEQSPGQRTSQGYRPRPGPGYGQSPEQRPGQGYGRYSGPASGQPPAQRNGPGPDRRYGTYPGQRNAP